MPYSLVNNDGKLSIGSPTLPSAKVVADVLEHIREIAGMKVMAVVHASMLTRDSRAARR